MNDRLILVFSLFLTLLIGRDAMAADLTGCGPSVHPGGLPVYQYVSFGTYPYEADGTESAVLWRVLGPGVPAKDDVIDEANAPDNKWKKTANTDDLSGENADVFCLMSEYILDMVLYNDVRDDLAPFLDYENSLMYASLNGPILSRIFTEEEQRVLIEMPDRGKLALPTRKGELFRTDYGFPAEDFTPSRTRHAKGSPYAYKQGLKRIDGYSWYFTADWRRPGQRWIVGDNGHISVSGVDRKGGIRPVVYVHTNQLTVLSGTGTPDDPLVLAPISN